MNQVHTIRAGIVGIFTLLLLALCPRLYAYDLTVDRSQAASATNFLTVQAAINAAPTGLTAPYTIFIKNGKYKEVVTVSSTKPFIQLVGESVANTIITYNNGASTVVAGAALGTQGSATVSVSAADFSAVNITFENSFGDGSQAVAILVNNDRAAFRNCRFLGNQDTMYLKGSGAPRHYFVNCYIEGNTDFIFGSSIALFESCNIYAKVKPSTPTSYIVAPNTTTGQAYGFVFKNCNVAGHSVSGGTSYDLGRPWQNSPQAAFLNCNLSTPLILNEGWAPTASAGTATLATSYFVEYGNTHFSGIPITTMFRVQSGTSFSPAQTDAHSQLTAGQAATYTTANILGSWNPCAVIDCATPFTRSVAVTNFKGTKGASTSTFVWNTSWPISGDVLTVYRASATPPGALSAFTANGTRTEPNDTLFNYTYSDTNPAGGSLYKYYVKGSVSPQQISSDTVTISSAPTIVVTGTVSAFSQLVGSPSTAQTVSVSATDLVANLSITAPTNYQLSLTVGGTYTSSLSLAPASGAVASTPIYIRLNAAGTGTYSGNVALTSTNATTVNLAVTGSTIVATPVTTAPLQWWPLRVSNADSASARNARLVATTPTLKHFYLANGTTVPAVTAYSNKFGMAVSSSNTSPGDGLWSTATGGTGGSIPTKRNYYTQFTVTAGANSTVRVDAVTMATCFYGSSSSINMGMTYSKSGFVSDSTEYTSGTLNGTTIAYTAASSVTSNLVHAFLLANNTNGPSATANLYRLVLSDPTGSNPTGGVTLTAGQTLTIHLYYTCSSSSNAKYALLKNLRIEGDAQATTVGNISLSNGTLTGAYNNVTITAGAAGDQVSVMLPLTVNNALTTGSGSILNTPQPIVGAGSVSIGAGSELRIADANGISSSGTSGPIRNTGTRSFSTDATYTYNGTVAQVTGTGLPATVRGITVNNTAALTANQTLTLSQATSVSQLVNLQKGTLVSGGNLTLLSVPNQGTALVDNTGGTVTGTVTMQRAFDVLTSDNIGYHQVSSPVLNPNIEVALANQNLTLNPAYNAAVLATQVRPFPTVFGYDERRLTPGNPGSGTSNTSPATDLGSFDKGYYSPTTGNPMNVGKGFTGSIPNANVLNFTGTLNNGGYNINGLTRGPVVLQDPSQAASGTNTDQSGWQLLGNPYPSPLNAQSLLTAQFTNLGTAIYVFHATSRYSGAYSVYTPSGTGAAGIGSTARAGDPSSAVLDAGSAFWVRVAGTSNGALTLSNTNRVTTFGTQPVFGRQASTRAELQLLLQGAGLTDAAHLYFEAQATAGVDAQFDAPKLTNSNGLNLALLAGNTQLAIDGRPAPTTATVLPLFVTVPAAGSYSLSAAALTGFTNLPVYLRDALTGSRTLLNAGTAYRFAMTTTTAPGRFALEFAPAGTALATAAQTLAAQVQLYPNPAQGRFHVVLPAGAKAASATLTNALGQVMLSRTLVGNEADFSLATPGVYTLRLTVDGNAVTRKVVVE